MDKSTRNQFVPSLSSTVHSPPAPISFSRRHLHPTCEPHRVAVKAQVSPLFVPKAPTVKHKSPSSTLMATLEDICLCYSSVLFVMSIFS
jgi:hypothetical protein